MKAQYAYSNLNCKEIFCHILYIFQAQDDLLGKSGSTASMPCSKCQVKIQHLRNHGGKECSIENCKKEMKEKSAAWYEKHSKENFLSAKTSYDDEGVTNVTSIKDLAKNAKKHGNVIMPSLLPFKCLHQYADPLLHLLLGLGNDGINELRKDCRKHDQTEYNDTRSKLERAAQMFAQRHEDICDQRKLTIVKIEELKHFKRRLAVTVPENEEDEDKENMPEDEEDEDKENIAEDAQDIANKYYRKKGEKQVDYFEDRQTCSSPVCLIYPVDRRHGKDDKIACTKCNLTFHWSCEALTSISEDVTNNGDNYICLKCKKYSKKDISRKMDKEIKSLETKTRELGKDMSMVEGKMNEKVLEIQRILGPAEKALEDSFKDLKTAHLSYHGGSLNGKDILKILHKANTANNIEDFILIKCIVDKDPEKAASHLKMFQILANCFFRLRGPQTDEDYLKKTIEICRSWCKTLPVLFPLRNITRKGHCLSYHVPEYLVKNPNLFHLFFKLEEKGESIHALFNKMYRERFLTVKPTEKRLLMMVEELERLHSVNKEVTKPRQYRKQ